MKALWARWLSRPAGRLSPVQLLTLGYGGLSLLGALVLMLPCCAPAAGQAPGFVDALFTASSAVTTTGLVVVDTGTAFSRIGQGVVLILIQLGGLGYMVFIALAVLGFGGRLSLSNRMLLRESMSRPTTVELVRFAKVIVLGSLAIELIGWLLLATRFQTRMPWSEALYQGLFHSISAYCTAGFSTYADSVTRFANDRIFNLTVIGAMLLGGIGFPVLIDLYVYGRRVKHRESPRRLPTHTRLVLMVLGVFTVTGTLVLVVFEPALRALPPGDCLLHGVFQAVSAISTAGFNSVDISALHTPSLFLMVLFMFVGCAPGGTAGGIKVTTAALVVLSLAAQVTGRPDVNLFHRRLPPGVIAKAMSVTLIALFWLVAVTLVLCMTEQASFLAIVFEVASALGTTGLSMGLTPELTTAGKLVIVVAMLVGRIGPLGVALSVVRVRRTSGVRYATGEVLVG